MEKLLMLGGSFCAKEMTECAKAWAYKRLQQITCLQSGQVSSSLQMNNWMISTGDLDKLEQKCNVY